jgi:hypothetical protein
MFVVRIFQVRLNYSSRFWLYAPITLFLLIAVAVMLHWKFTADAFEKKLAALKGAEAVPGIVIDWKSVAVGGFPFRLDADFTQFSIHGAGARGPFAWTGDKFALHTLSYARAKAVYEAAGHQHLEWVAADGAHTADFLPGTFHAGSITDDHGLKRFDVDIVDAGGVGFTAAELQLHLRRGPDGKNVDVMVKGDRVAGHKLVQAYATLADTGELMPLLAGIAPWPDAVTAWHGHGGEVRLSKGVEPDVAARALSALY